MRFFLASPCKRDLRIFRDVRTCATRGLSNDADPGDIDEAKDKSEFNQLVFEFYTSTDSAGKPYLVET